MVWPEPSQALPGQVASRKVVHAAAGLIPPDASICMSKGHHPIVEWSYIAIYFAANLADIGRYSSEISAARPSSVRDGRCPAARCWTPDAGAFRLGACAAASLLACRLTCIPSEVFPA